MLTVKEFKDLSGEFVFGDTCQVIGAIEPFTVNDTWIRNAKHSEFCDRQEIKSFAWRPLNTLPDNQKFKIEFKNSDSEFENEMWRPLLDQSVDIYACDDCYDNSEITIKYVDAHVSGERIGVMSNGDEVELVAANDDKPVFTQEIADIEYELSLHKANSELLASLTDFMVKNGIGRIGESCIDVAIRELSEKFNIDTRTPKQKAVDEMLSDSRCSGSVIEVALERLYYKGYRKC